MASGVSCCDIGARVDFRSVDKINGREDCLRKFFIDIGMDWVGMPDDECGVQRERNSARADGRIIQGAKADF